MNEWPEDLIARYARKPLVVDTNLLVLLIVGSFDRTLITRFKRTQKYMPDDLDVLVALLSFFPAPLVTPHIWAETIALLRQLPEPYCSRCQDLTVRLLIEQAHETYLTAKELAAVPGFVRFGITDAGIEQLAKTNLIVSDDLPLVQYLTKLNAAVLNFNYLRNWDRQ